VQEAVNNAVRHGRARRIVLEFKADSNHLVASVSDDGHGIAPGTPEGSGMLGMRERAALVGGRLAVHHRHPGTEIRVEVPIS
jgi:two-component system, NarL family, sensor histidine kinase UhpB